jgi:hypothetical protein
MCTPSWILQNKSRAPASLENSQFALTKKKYITSTDDDKIKWYQYEKVGDAKQWTQLAESAPTSFLASFLANMGGD